MPTAPTDTTETDARRLRALGHADILIFAATGVPAASLRGWPVDRDAWRRWSADHPADAHRLAALIGVTLERRRAA
ncbi:MAG: hypothetical protein JO021_21985 [Alphaproteobacteria bacterium]|nr:hypothetical protein [Alphaproteobacteria bacterium]